ncbi:minichromosome maintenance protein MCM [Candidatus Woesearchaeota archaeon]|nr:minichromosome maintenance protein MCM [Candidatus Woesearchaeota archaeon]
MEAADQVKKFQEFLEKHMDEIQTNIKKENNFFVIDFPELSKFDHTLADELLETPDEIIKAAELAVESFDIKSDNFKIRFRNLPDDQQIKIKNIRSKNIGKFLFVDGVVRQKSDVRPQVTSTRFECPSCGNIIYVLQLDSKFKEPSRCGCGRKGKFRLLSKELVDAQGIVLEESSEDLEGGEQPKRINIFLQNDLVSPISDRKTNPGSKIRVYGFVKEIPIILRSGGQSTRFDLLIESNYVESIEEGFFDIEINEKEVEEIKEISKDPKLYEKLINSVAPSIYGYKRVKEALLLQLVGGVRKVRGDGMITRGDIHVLLVGDPGAGKSQLLKRVNIVAPKGRYVSGKGVSGAGLTAAVVRDEFLKGWALEAGALVLASNGICCIDEIDKMTTEDRAAMHEALEQQTISISKANIQATLMARTTVLAAANPKFGRFDPYDILAKQIDLPPTLINRFDLIFPIKDLPDEDKDYKMADHILNLHQNPDFNDPEIETKILKKYIAYVRRNINPSLTEDALTEIKRYYLEMRGKSSSEEAALRTVPISPRQLEALIRLTEAAARLRFSNKAEKKDAKKATYLLHSCLAEIGVDPETGKIDIDRISSGIPATERTKITNVKGIINELENTIGKTIPIDDIVREAAERGMDDAKVEEAIEKLKRSGDLFEPRKGFIQKL